ncbi:hypothetical protein GHT06_009896 [Daphnia sinensis]|uniref:Reverse transcriptase domain-containing protein n=1 Tax=Daphnia sinensis TaxID=1820382 RepID=A0AAD5LHL1_9CRUS|nr:hypothetical protein GHT06_009896 [Daphnia sinensis]
MASRVKKRKTKSDNRTIRTALKLWAVVYHDIISVRRRNILSQIYPQNIGLLHDTSILPTGGDHLFGPKFTQSLVEQVKTLNALEGAAERLAPRERNSSYQQPGRNSSQPASSGGHRNNNHANRLQFWSEPFQSSVQPNTAMDLYQQACCEKEVASLLEKGAVGLNRFLVQKKFKIEGISTIRHTVQEGDWLAKLDLKDAYLTVPIFEGHRQFLPFYVGALAPWAFTKLLLVAVAFLRKRGIRVVIYLDDILDDIFVVAYSHANARLVVGKIKSLLKSLGFVISTEKSVEDSVQSLEYIGLIINTIELSQGRGRRTLVELEEPRRILLPLIQPNPVLPLEDLPGASRDRPDSSLLAEPVLVPDLMELAFEIPLLLFPVKSLLTSPLEECHPLTQNESLRLIAGRLSGNVLESPPFGQKLLSSSSVHHEPIHTLHTNQPGSLGAVCVWNGKVNPMSAGVNEVLVFLSNYFDSGNCYRSVNVARSMLSSTLGMNSLGSVELHDRPLDKEQLKEASIDTTTFSAHSTRGAAASKAAASGIPIQAVLNQGHWFRESTFAKFYKRDIPLATQ